MNLEQKINTDLKEAMKAKDTVALRSIRAIKAAILLTKTDGSGAEMDESAEIKLVQKLVKQRSDSLNIFVTQGREDLAQKEREEIEVISKYLPKQLTEEELKEVISNIVSEIGANSPKDMGKVIAAANIKLAGAADGKAIAEMTKTVLNTI